MKIDRQMGIISYLMDHQKTTAKSLASLFDVSVRTIMRDIDDLTLAGIPLYLTPGRNGGIFLMDSVKKTKPPLTKNELSSIETSLKSRYQVLRDDATFNAILKLNRINMNPDFEIDLSLSKGNIELRKTVFQLLDSIRRTETISFNYINSQGNESKKHCEPYRIVFKDRSWYLDAYDREKKRFRVYKVARISSIARKDSFVKRNYVPVTYDGGAWMNENKIPLTIHASRYVIDKFIELLGSDAIEKVDHQWYQVIYPLHDNEWGYNVLLGYGKHIKIIEPQSFITNFVHYLDAIKQHYV